MKRWQPTELFLITMGLLALLGVVMGLTLELAAKVQAHAIERQHTLAPRSQHGPDISHCLEDSNTQPLWDCIRYVKEDESEHQ